MFTGKSFSILKDGKFREEITKTIVKILFRAKTVIFSLMKLGLFGFEIGLNWVCFGLNWVCFGLNWLCFGLNWVCFGLNWLCFFK